MDSEAIQQIHHRTYTKPTYPPTYFRSSLGDFLLPKTIGMHAISVIVTVCCIENEGKEKVCELCYRKSLSHHNIAHSYTGTLPRP